MIDDTVEIFRCGEWIPWRRACLSIGNRFRFGPEFEVGDPYTRHIYPAGTVFVCTSDPVTSIVGGREYVLVESHAELG